MVRFVSADFASSSVSLVDRATMIKSLTSVIYIESVGQWGFESLLGVPLGAFKWWV